jgi:DNA (cytosine-5)-methyltransferase 1
MRYISVCSGIEAASVAWHPLGFEPAAFAEIEPAPSAVLTEHFPHVPNAGDFTKIQGTEYGSIDLLVGGTPCQAFSTAGRRAGLSDARGNLALEYIRLANRCNQGSAVEWLLWENVPGVLSSSHGNDFRCFLSELTGVDISIPQKGWKTSGLIVGMDRHYSVAWRVLDAQYFGVPQRRRRVFLVGHLGDWRRAAAVLFEPQSLLGNPPPRREEKQDTAIHAGTSIDSDSGCSYSNAEGNTDLPSLTASNIGKQGSNQSPLIAYAIQTAQTSNENFIQADHSYTLDCSHQPQAVAFQVITRGDKAIAGESDVYPTLQCTQMSVSSNTQHGVRLGTAVRRLTPIECERLQGFPDTHTLVQYKGKPMSDAARYKMCGNSMAVPVMRWIGERMMLTSS